MSFRIENLLLQLFIKVAGLLPRARPEPIPLKGPLKGTAFRDPRLVGSTNRHKTHIYMFSRKG